MPQLLTKVREAHGDDYELGHLDLTARTATFMPTVGVAQFVGDTLTLPRTLATPAAGDRVASMIQEQQPGYVMVEFDPHRGIARRAKLTGDEIVTRQAVAEALGVKPWEVGVAVRDGGGYLLTSLPARYTPSRHHSKLTEVAETKVPGGKPGWYVRVDGTTLTGEIVPAELPTFEPVYPYPLDTLATVNRDVIPFGVELPHPGDTTPRVASLNLATSASVLVAGLANGGKTVTLSALVAGSLASGSELSIITTTDKSVDFTWCRDMVRDGGWGCESLEHAAAVVYSLYQEGSRRSEWLKANAPGVANWLQLPPDQQFRPSLLVFDEFSAITDQEKTVGMSKNDPMRDEIEYENMLRSRIKRYTQKIMREMRFVGLRVIVSSQVSNAQTGLGPTDKAQMGHRVLCGSNPSPAARNQAFNDPQSVPEVPGNVRADSGAARGAGSYSSEGRHPAVFKSFYAPMDSYRSTLFGLGVPTTTRPEPSAAEVAAAVPDSDMGGDDWVVTRLDSEGGWGELDGRDTPEQKLTGAAKAAHDHRTLMNGGGDRV